MRFLSLITGKKRRDATSTVADTEETMLTEEMKLTEEDILRVVNKWKGKPHYIFTLPNVLFKDCKREAIKLLTDAGIIIEHQDGSMAVLENMFSCLNCIEYVSGDRYTRSKCLAKNEEMQMVGLEKGRFCPHFMNRKVYEVLKAVKR